MVKAYFVCPSCGFYREANDAEIKNESNPDKRVQHHCRDCKEPLIQRCPNSTCTCFIDDLTAKFCDCGEDWSFLKKVKERRDNDDPGNFVKPREF